MKKSGITTFFVLLSLLLGSCSHEQGKRAKGDAVITFTETKHEFGEIPFRGNGDCEFTFRNNGKTPLVLTHVKSTCGCTVPEWPSEPIQAGQEGSIHVTYDTKRVGVFTKSIYVYSNASNGVQQLFITGRVKPFEQETVN
jgi:hypothetical protein